MSFLNKLLDRDKNNQQERRMIYHFGEKEIEQFLERNGESKKDIEDNIHLIKDFCRTYNKPADVAFECDDISLDKIKMLAKLNKETVDCINLCIDYSQEKYYVINNVPKSFVAITKIYREKDSIEEKLRRIRLPKELSHLIAIKKEILSVIYTDRIRTNRIKALKSY